MPKFEHLGGGSHDHNDGKVYSKGDIISATMDLEKMFPQKFRRVDFVVAPEPPPVGAVPVPPSAGAAPTSPPPKKLQVKVKPKDARGDDVTGEFKFDGPGLKVFQRGDFFHVYEGDKVAPIHPKGLRKQEVLNVIKNFLEE
jgi:hypothetical protein